jgi:hypothetical protein
MRSVRSATSSFSVFSEAGPGFFIQSQAGKEARTAAAATIFNASRTIRLTFPETLTAAP